MIRIVNGMQGMVLHLPSSNEDRRWIAERLEVAVEADPEHHTIYVSLIDKGVQEDITVVLHEHTLKEWEQYL